MKLNKRKSNGIYMVTLDDGRRVSTGERTKPEAERAARIIRDNNGKLPTVRGSKWTLGEALDDTYERIWKHQKSARGAYYRAQVIVREDGHVDVSTVSYAWLVAYVERHRQQGMANCSINRKLSSIRMALRESFKLGLIPAVPEFPYQKEKRGKLRWLTPEEQVLLCRQTADMWSREDAEFMENMINVLCYTGARFGEFYKACVTESFTATRITFLDTKNGTDRSVPLAQPVPMMLRACSEFLCERRGKLSYQGIHLRFSKLVKQCGLEGVTMHTLRHTCASRLVQGGADLYRVMHWLGHKDIHTTQIYAHLAPESLDTMTAHLIPPVAGPAHGLHSVRKKA